jgi:hypothetical protein
MTTLPKGYLKATFDERTSASSSGLNTHILEELCHNLSIGEGAQSAGLMPTGYESKSAFTEQQKQKRKKDYANFLHQLHMARLQLMQELIDLQEAIEELTCKIEEKGRCIESIDAYLKESIAAGKFKVTEDGYPIDERLRDLIKQWEKDNLRKWDCSDENEALEILNSIKREQDAYKVGFEAEREERKVEWENKNDQLNSIDETISLIDQNGMDSRTLDKGKTLLDDVYSKQAPINPQVVEQIAPLSLENLKI